MRFFPPFLKNVSCKATEALKCVILKWCESSTAASVLPTWVEVQLVNQIVSIDHQRPLHEPDVPVNLPVSVQESDQALNPHPGCECAERPAAPRLLYRIRPHCVSVSLSFTFLTSAFSCCNTLSLQLRGYKVWWLMCANMYVQSPNTCEQLLWWYFNLFTHLKDSYTTFIMNINL